MPLSLNALLALSVALCLSLQYGMGVPLSSVSDLGSDPALNSAPHRVRSKRCSCNNQMDSECHYFCHLDIIWVNTPSKTTIYGLGSPLSRRRRSTGRCACANPADHTCNSFCHNSSLNPTLVVVNPSPLSLGSSDDTSSNLLTSLRYAVRANLLAARLGVSPEETLPDPQIERGDPTRAQRAPEQETPQKRGGEDRRTRPAKPNKEPRRLD